MRLFLVSVWVIAGLHGFGQSAVGDIKGLMQDQEDAWNAGSLEGFMAHYWQSDSLMFIGSSGLNLGWDNLMGRYQRGYVQKDAMGELAFKILSAEHLAPNVILVIGEWEVTAEKEASRGFFTLNWKKFPSGWKIVCDHTGKSE